MTKNNGKVIIKNVLCTSLRGCQAGRDRAALLKKSKSKKPSTFKDDLKAVLSKLQDTRVALLAVDMAIAAYKGEAGVSVSPAPEILDQETFPAPDSSSSSE